MTTLGEKVTTTLVGAVLQGITSTGTAQHKDLKPLIEDQIKEYLKNPELPASVKLQLQTIRSSSSLTDVFVAMISMVLGLIQSLISVGEPVADRVRQAAWDTIPVKLPAEQAIVLGWLRGADTEAGARSMLRKLGYDSNKQNSIIATIRPLLSDQAIVEAERRDLLDPMTATEYLKRIGFVLPDINTLKALHYRLLDDDAIRELYLRGDISDTKLPDYLKHIGFRDIDIPLLTGLYWRIPPVPDIIRMAVREAFTPEIAERFGQYQDLPPDFVTWAARQGLSEDWSKRYWAAHWDLPSAMQGFEMLHRGVITQDDLQLLLRALDVMPFWRERLTLIAYNPYTRVDVRRMYQTGVLNREDVKRAYLDLGYDETHAENLTEFAVRSATQTDQELAKTDILDGYRLKIMDRTTAQALLADLEYSEESIAFYLNREDLKRARGYSDDLVQAYRQQYLSGMISLTEAATKLQNLAVDIDVINELLTLWQAQRETKEYSPEVMVEKDLTKADILDGYQRKAVTQDRARELLGALGYSEDEITFYLNREDLKDSQSYQDSLVQAYRQQYLSGMITQDEARSRLQGSGVEPDRVNQLLTLWQVQKDTKEYSPEAIADKDLTKGEITSGYIKGLVSREEAESYLSGLGYDAREVGYLLTQADYDKARQVKDLSLTTYKSLYIMGLLDKTAVTSALVAQGFAKEELQWLYTLWDIEAVSNLKGPTKAELRSFLSKGIIGLDQFQEELTLQGYNPDAISWYVAEVQQEELDAARKEQERAQAEADRVAKAEVKSKYEEDKALIDLEIATVRVFVAEKRYALTLGLTEEEAKAVQQDIAQAQYQIADLQKQKAALKLGG